MATAATHAHPDTPFTLPLSEYVTDGDYFKWNLSPEEREHIAVLLDCPTTTITTQHSKMMQDRKVCTTCSKPSGLDDLVQNALVLNIHSAEFMRDVLVNGPKNSSPGHDVYCSGCGTKHQGQMFWNPALPWFDRS